MKTNVDEVLHRFTNGLIEQESVLAFDAAWQYPAITEQHAFQKVCDLLPGKGGSYLYLGFPWATLLDLIFHRPSSNETEQLREILNLLKARVPRRVRIITVCQHIFMLEFQTLFHEVGVTDVFWSHATKPQPAFPDFPDIRIYPFPLFPVQLPGNEVSKNFADREHLFSFMGAKAKGVGLDAVGVYLAETRNIILRELSEHAQGMVVGREGWHYENVVYGKQIRKEGIQLETSREEAPASEFREVLAESRFSLCPSGTGPNSIRLWESLAHGAIPVILADTWLPPGDADLWEEAAVFCREDVDSIKALPSRLEQLAKDEEVIARKQQALRCLWERYGPGCFIHDIQKLVDAISVTTKQTGAPALQSERLITLAEFIGQMDDEELANSAGAFVLGCAARVREDAQGFLGLYLSNGLLRRAYKRAMSAAAPDHVKSMIAAIKSRNIDLG